MKKMIIALALLIIVNAGVLGQSHYGTMKTSQVEKCIAEEVLKDIKFYEIIDSYQDSIKTVLFEKIKKYYFRFERGCMSIEDQKKLIKYIRYLEGDITYVFEEIVELDSLSHKEVLKSLQEKVVLETREENNLKKILPHHHIKYKEEGVMDWTESMVYKITSNKETLKQQCQNELVKYEQRFKRIVYFERMIFDFKKYFDVIDSIEINSGGL